MLGLANAVEAVLCEALGVSVYFQFPVAVAANNPFEFLIQFAGNWMIFLEAK
jgi:hypothetical protein